MSGVITLARPARWFARNGQLRFTFRGISRENAEPSVVHGQLASAEARPGDRVNISNEGIAKSSSGAGKYLAPMALGVMAAPAFDGDATSNPVHSGVDSNGLGFAARVLSDELRERGSTPHVRGVCRLQIHLLPLGCTRQTGRFSRKTHACKFC